MYWHYYIILLFLCIECTSKAHGNQDAPIDSNMDECVVKVDSIPAIYLDIENFWNCSDSVRVQLSNPYSNLIELDGEYYIHDMDNDSQVLHEPMQRLTINPGDSIIFKVSLGMDSIWYDKKRTYRFSFPGKSQERDVVFYESLSNLGYINKVNGDFALVPDKICLPLAVINDSGIDNVQETP